MKYDLNHPDEKFFMPEDLNEISGLSYYQPNQLACVQDEEGLLFIYDTQQKRVVRHVRFAHQGDYEGVEVVKENVYVVRSDGTLYRSNLTDSVATDVIETTQVITTPLSVKNDVEGLGYDPTKNQLLLVCKESPTLDGSPSKSKAVYGYDLSQNQLIETPVFEIDVNALEKRLQEASGNGKGKFKFKPSGLAFHPIDRQFYMIASAGNLLVVLNLDGSVETAVPLNPSIYRQPEGICFFPDGTMFISSEGDGETGYILQFNQR
ncbi:MAG: SdiA-regulated domain-containing protein [Bacteroidota bacterium]